MVTYDVFKSTIYMAWKPNCYKGKHTTAVHVRQPLAKKSQLDDATSQHLTANMRLPTDG